MSYEGEIVVEKRKVDEGVETDAEQDTALLNEREAEFDDPDPHPDKYVFLSNAVDSAVLIDTAASKTFSKKTLRGLTALTILFVGFYLGLKIWQSVRLRRALVTDNPEWTLVFLPFWIFLCLLVVQMCTTIVVANYVNAVVQHVPMGARLCFTFTILPFVATIVLTGLALLPVLTFLLHLDGYYVNTDLISVVLYVFAALVPTVGFITFLNSCIRHARTSKRHRDEHVWFGVLANLIREGGLLLMAIGLGIYGTLVSTVVADAQVNQTEPVPSFAPEGGWWNYLFAPSVLFCVGVAVTMIGTALRFVEEGKRNGATLAIASVLKNSPPIFFGAMLGALVSLLSQYADGYLTNPFTAVSPILIEAFLTFFSTMVYYIMAAKGKTDTAAESAPTRFTASAKYAATLERTRISEGV